MTQQPEALRHAAYLRQFKSPQQHQAAAVLERQHTEIETLRTGYDAARMEIASLHAQPNEPHPTGQLSALTALGKRLAELPDEDQWTECEKLLMKIERGPRRNMATSAAQPADEKDSVCEVPPLGWRCTRTRGHDGPCAAVESPEDKAFVERGMRRIRDAEDAGRYRLLKRGQHWSVIDGAGDTLRGEVLEAAVDAAIAAQQGEKT